MQIVVLQSVIVLSVVAPLKDTQAFWQITYCADLNTVAYLSGL
jgi:hypothetical protein